MKHKIIWEKGSGAMMSLAIALPFVTLLLTFMVSAFQYSITMNRMEYATYRCARSAVTCESLSQAKTAVTDMADRIGAKDFLISEIDTSVTYTDCGSSETDMSGGNGGAEYTDYRWKKGNFINVELTGTYKFLIPFTEKTLHVYLTMMIENEPHDN